MYKGIIVCIQQRMGTYRPVNQVHSVGMTNESQKLSESC